MNIKRTIVLSMAGVFLAGCSNSPPAPTATVTVTQSPTSSVSSDEQAFVNAVRENTDLDNTATDAKIIEVGHAVCRALDQGNTVDDLIRQGITDDMSQSLAHDLGFVIGAAIGALCPEYSDQVQSGSTT